MELIIFTTSLIQEKLYLRLRIVSEKLIDKYANEFAAYLEAEHKVSDKLTLQYGAWSTIRPF